jgi:hypothetical protein
VCVNPKQDVHHYRPPPPAWTTLAHVSPSFQGLNITNLFSVRLVWFGWSLCSGRRAYARTRAMYLLECTIVFFFALALCYRTCFATDTWFDSMFRWIEYEDFFGGRLVVHVN